MKKYDKLIRDKIPEIIAADGKEYKVEVMDDDKYKKYLDKKLKEEVEEYLESGEVEELADVMEVLYAIMQVKGVSVDEVERIRKEKADKRGSFEKKLRLLKVFDSKED